MQIRIICLYLQSCSKNRPTNLGEVVEWSITAVLKTVELKGSGGSNPSLSAKEKENQRRARSKADFLFLLQRPAAGGEGCRSASGATKSRRGRDSCKGPRGERKGMWRTQCGKSHGERGILARTPAASGKGACKGAKRLRKSLTLR